MVASGKAKLAGVGVRILVEVVTEPRVKGSVARSIRSFSCQRIWSAGPTVAGEPFADFVRMKPQTPPRKSVVSEVQVKPLGTQYIAVSPAVIAGNPSPDLSLLAVQPTTNPLGQIAGE